MQQLQKNSNIYDELKKTKNLLAFSGGVDSCALFYLLVEFDVEFDIAIVDYNIRTSSKDEVAYAKELAQKYNKKIFTKSVHLKSANFEKNARDERYEFFTLIMKENGYNTLLTAHHLGDKLEWFFMMLTRGAGAVELCGFSQIEDFKDYKIVRPLIRNTKEELLEYLDSKGYKYFIDESNFDEKYERNYFRKYFSEPLLKKYKDGIKRSFEALEVDKKLLLNSEYKNIHELYFFKRSQNEMRQIAKILKFFKIVLSTKQREEVEKNSSVVISGKIAIGKNEKFVFICPFVENTIMTKKFKEECRINKIPIHIRSYIFSKNINLENIFT